MAAKTGEARTGLGPADSMEFEQNKARARRSKRIERQEAQLDEK